uniref:RING-type domain-containing protein n=1 Tax=Araucaria cunninghamii TaxID=56994 RepID=A0A0D6R7V2_ARACU
MSFSLHSFERTLWEVFLALVMLCGGMAMVVLVYMWLAWYSSLHAMRERDINGNDASKAAARAGLSKSDIEKFPTFVCSSAPPTSADEEEKEEEEEDEEKRGSNELNGSEPQIPNSSANGNGKKKGKKSKESGSDEFYINGESECTVCLEQFKDGDRCVQLPACRHCCFHAQCADQWLSKNPICPLCRASALPSDAASAVKDESNGVPLEGAVAVEIPD